MGTSQQHGALNDSSHCFKVVRSTRSHRKTPRLIKLRIMTIQLSSSGVGLQRRLVEQLRQSIVQHLMPEHDFGQVSLGNSTPFGLSSYMIR